MVNNNYKQGYIDATHDIYEELITRLSESTMDYPDVKVVNSIMDEIIKEVLNEDRESS